MRTTIDLDEALVERARELTGLRTKKEVVDAALRLLVDMEEQSSVRELRGRLRWEGDLDMSRTDRRS